MHAVEPPQRRVNDHRQRATRHLRKRPKKCDRIDLLFAGRQQCFRQRLGVAIKEGHFERHWIDAKLLYKVRLATQGLEALKSNPLELVDLGSREPPEVVIKGLASRRCQRKAVGDSSRFLLSLQDSRSFVSQD